MKMKKIVWKQFLSLAIFTLCIVSAPTRANDLSNSESLAKAKAELSKYLSLGDNYRNLELGEWSRLMYHKHRGNQDEFYLRRSVLNKIQIIDESVEEAFSDPNKNFSFQNTFAELLNDLQEIECWNITEVDRQYLLARSVYYYSKK